MPPAAAFDLPKYWQTWRAAIDTELDRLSARREPDTLWDAMRYSLQAGGKRVRPLLTLATLEALGRDPRPALPAACALELIHTQSLIHDDLPAMDNDDLRRGKPTNHKVFGEANAILAGDALMAHAFALLATELAPAYRPDQALAATRELAEATVAMVAGQVVDIQSEGQVVGAAVLEYIHRHKTGALIRAAVRIGGILGEAAPAEMARLNAYAEELGLAFQIADDILDVTKTADELGKTPGKDQDAGKATYVTLHGLASARRLLAESHERALAPLAGWGERATALGAIVGYVVDQVA
jgi:geranylgeranyl diphosphate synthase type II